MEGILFFIIVAVFLVLTFLRFPRGVSFLLISAIIMVLSEKKFTVSTLLEGAFGYFDAVLTVLTAMIFIVAIEKSGLLNHLANFLTLRFSTKPRLLLLLSTILAMSGGMITGSSSASVLTTGAVAFPILKTLGLDNKKAGTLIAISSVCGMIAPPVNIQAMVICEGVDMPYVGFTYPLLWLTVPTALVMSLILAGKDLKKPVLNQKFHAQSKDIFLYSPLIVFIVLSILDSLGKIRIGLPLVFMLSALTAIFSTRKKLNFVEISMNAMEQSLPILAILVGVGMLIQVMTLSGVRGFIVANMLFFPYGVLFITVGLGVPLFGAVSSYGAASVLGIPFLLAFRGGNDIVIASAISLLAGLGDMLPPTALASTVSAQIAGLNSYLYIFRRSIPYLFIIGLISVMSVLYSSRIAKVIENPWWFWITIGLIFVLCFLRDRSYRKGDVRI
ncbi:MAG TPA: TRAP transporter large permease subunit [Pseudothermotoga sp.]|nr:TRAP transporter large permease subunit [Pseudothermotoga sp.]HOK84244.1 TRAP transporter large permease subunit [Pseudothermotoga sp.]HPP71053.1 TRAP transporter large permease subunit [Pseudothermotoga sp.]